MKCRYCKFIWEPRVKVPRACPSCKRYFYDKPIPPTKDNLKTNFFTTGVNGLFECNKCNKKLTFLEAKEHKCEE